MLVLLYWRDIMAVEFLSGLATTTTAFPETEDLAGAAEALLRLQDTYALDTHKVASGDLMGVRDSPRMSGISSKYVVNNDKEC